MSWKPGEIIIHDKVKNDPVTLSILGKCPGVPVKYVPDGKATTINAASDIISKALPLIGKILAGKQVLHIAPATDLLDVFTMPDERMLCPHFERLKLASNGCYYMCDWCYLKLTCRWVRPFIIVRAQYDVIKKQILKRADVSDATIMLSTGELADSLSLEHLTGAARELIPLFATLKNAYLYMLTKSTNVDGILDLHHNGHTIVAWSLNNAEVSRQFELGAPAFQQRIEAARKVQEAGYRLRLRLDPILPIKGWKAAYADTVEQIFKTVQPERITLGTLRFEKQYYYMRNKLLTTGDAIKEFIDQLVPMFKPRGGKYSFPTDQRTEIFQFVVNEIKKHSDCNVALCKESAEVWDRVGLDRSRCSCVCQYDSADMGDSW